MPDAVLPPLTLITGTEDLLISRALAELTAAGRASDPGVDVLDVDAKQLGEDLLMDLATPSLFGGLRLVVVRSADELEKKDNQRLGEGLAQFVRDPAPDVALVLVHPTGGKGKLLVEAAKSAGAKVISCARLKPAEEVGFVQQEFRRHDRQATPAACRAVAEALGSASAMKTGTAARREVLGELAAACAQLAADTFGVIDEADVARYLRGRAEASGFNLADYTIDGEVGRALAELRFAFATNLDPVLLVGALASRVRAVARVATVGRGSDEDIGRLLGMSPYAVKIARRQGRAWTPDTLIRAHELVAAADVAVKGGGADPGYAVERAVLEITRVRQLSA